MLVKFYEVVMRFDEVMKYFLKSSIDRLHQKNVY